MTLINRVVPLVLALLLSACINVPEVDGPEIPDAGLPDAGPKPDAGVPADTTPPTVTATMPLHGSTNVATSAQMVLTFSEPMNVSTVQVNITPTVALSGSTWSNGNTQLTLQPTAPLAQNTTFTLVADGKDVAGNALTERTVFSFTTTGPAPDTAAPTVLGVSPNYGAIGVARNAAITVTFSEPMDKASAQTAFAITAPPGFNSGVFDWNVAGTEMTFNPDTDFSYGTEVNWRISTAAKDQSSNTMENSATGTFRAIRKTAVTLPYDETVSDMVFNYGEDSVPRFRYYVGDDAGNTHASRTFFGVSLSGLPQDLTQITSAQFRLRITGTIGAPFSKLGNLLLESVNYGPTLDRTTSDYNTPPLGPGVSVPSSIIGGEGFFDVLQFVKDDWANRNARSNYSEFRLRFEIQNNTDSATDAIYFEREEPALIPEFAKLLLEYEHP
jgi:hypothetical protein